MILQESIYTGEANGKRYRGIISRGSDEKYYVELQSQDIDETTVDLWFTDLAIDVDFETDRDAIWCLESIWEQITSPPADEQN